MLLNKSLSAKNTFKMSKTPKIDEIKINRDVQLH